jgi:hypothetical protein
VATGVLLGFFAMGQLQGDKAFQRMIGGILLGMVVVHVWRQRQLARDPVRTNDRIPHRMWFAALMGTMAGFTTMVANAAGPVMILYMLSMQLPKMEFLGTGAWFFLAVNLFKVPFSYQLDLITAASLTLDLRLAPPVVVGAVLGRLLIGHINQRLFETLALALTVLAAARMLL